MKTTFFIGALAATVALGSAAYLLAGGDDETNDDERRQGKSVKGKRVAAGAGPAIEDRSDWELEDRVAALENEVTALRRQVKAIQLRTGAPSSFGGEDEPSLEIDDPAIAESLREIVAQERERERDQEQERRRERMKERTDELLDELVTQANISGDQRDKIGTLWTQERDQTFALMTDARTGDRDFREVRDEARQLRQATDEQVKALLTDEQFTAYDELRPRGQGGRGGPGGGRGEGRGGRPAEGGG